ncbi:MAG: hypothetical protein KGJ32_07250 [Xanthomonadaceae bacterium]|nr:hypothetical protein [Xanthomonadaceae bacterium]
MDVYNLVQGTSGDDNLTGTAGHDAVYGLAGNDVLDGAGGVDRLIGGLGDDEYDIHDSATTIIENAHEGQDTVVADVNYSLGDNLERLVLASGSSAAQAAGNSADNVLIGNALDNVLDGGQGADTLQGGAGNDTYYVDQTGDRIQENAGEGTDTVVTTLDWTLGDQVENLTLIGSADFVHLTGNGLDNVLHGNDNTTYFDGGAGADTMIGGLSSDFYTVDSPDDVIVEKPGGGDDGEYRTYESLRALDSNVEVLWLADGVQTGTGNALDNGVYGNASANTLFGLAGDDYLEGDAGNDYLDGGAGADEMDAGTGDDTYIVDSADDLVVENADEGTDQVQASVSTTLSDNVENLFLSGSDGIDGTGNALGNYLAGNAGDNTLKGMDGDDTLAASGGNDVLIGGAGNDAYVFDGTAGSAVIDNTGGGNDGIFFINGITADRLSFGQDGNDLLVFLDGGANRLIRVTDHFLGGDASLDYLQTSDGTTMTTDQINQAVSQAPVQYDQTIVGTSAAEQLVGSAGNDLIQGLDGNDQLFGLAGDDALQGGVGDDYLSGGDGSGSGSGADTLEGGDGNDTLVGEDGNDTMIGGRGDDQYVYGGGQDVIDNSDGGNDGIFFNDGITASGLAFSQDGNDLVITVGGDPASTVRVSNHFLGGDAAIDYVQPASGSLLDTATINALVDGGSSGGGGTSGETGNDADYGNVVDGTSAGEQLLGTSGRDLIHGLGGDDTIFGFGGDDKFEGGDGNDYLSGGNGSFSGSGDDILIGGNGDDTLVGEDGSDMLIGGAGNDQYVWQTGSGSDTIDNTGGGTDWLFFTDIDRTRLGFHQDGDDLVIMVDEDSMQSVRVKNYFLGGDYVISYVQPSDGYAIPASDIDGMLTPMPSGSNVTTAAFAAQPATVGSAASAILPPAREAADPGSFGQLHDHSGNRLYARGLNGAGLHALGSPSTDAYGYRQAYRFTGRAQPDPQVHRLVQAMSDFDGGRITEMDIPGHDDFIGLSLAAERNMHRQEFGHLDRWMP